MNEFSVMFVVCTIPFIYLMQENNLNRNLTKLIGSRNEMAVRMNHRNCS